MSIWLKAIESEIDKQDIDNLFEPTEEVGDRDHVVGLLENDLKKLFSYTQLLTKQMTNESIKIESEAHKEREEFYKQQFFKIAAQKKVLMEVFWISVKDAFDLWGKSSIGIRKGWKIVWSELIYPDYLDIPSMIVRCLSREHIEKN